MLLAHLLKAAGARIKSTTSDADYFKNKLHASEVYSLRKHACIILTPWNSLLYSKTGIYKGIHYFSYFCSKNIDCGYSLEMPRRVGSNEYLQSMFWAEIWKTLEFFFIWEFSVFVREIFYIFE